MRNMTKHAKRLKFGKLMTQNYRPVSLTGVICKILEKFIIDILLDHLMKKQAYIRETVWVRAWTLLHLAIATMCRKLDKSLRRGIQVDVIYTDYSKAFDRVSHSKLLKKLDGLGVRGNILGWIPNFLCGRRQKV